MDHAVALIFFGVVGADLFEDVIALKGMFFFLIYELRTNFDTCFSEVVLLRMVWN